MDRRYALLFRKEIDWLVLAKTLLKDNQIQDFFNQARNAVQDLFYENGNLRFEFLMTIPVSAIGATRRTLDVLKAASGWDNVRISGLNGDMEISLALKNVEAIEENMKNYLKLHSNFTIFYSWQSDSDPTYNRNFIEEILDKAINEVNKTSDTKILLDKNTRGETGSPDIFNVILSKIDSAMCFVADVTGIVKFSDKEIPNPNVMCELGYAFSSLGDYRVILLCNEAITDPKNLPFDLGKKRAIIYRLDSASTAEEKAQIKKNLLKTFTIALSDISNL